MYLAHPPILFVISQEIPIILCSETVPTGSGSFVGTREIEKSVGFILGCFPMSLTLRATEAYAHGDGVL